MVHATQNAPTFYFKAVRLAALHVGLALQSRLVDGIGDVIGFALVNGAGSFFFSVGGELSGRDVEGEVDGAADRLEQVNVRLKKVDDQNMSEA